MSESPETELTPAERVDDIPRILHALRQATYEALRSHKRDGNPVAVWRNARVEWIQAADIPVQPESSGID
jgi:hypothetical protein